MQIERVTVREFVGLRQLDHGFELPQTGGLVIIEGPNEAGKTTLLRFVNAMLFGTEDAHGALVLNAGDGRYRLEQSGKRKTLTITELSTGNACESGRLEGLLGHLDAKVYGNIFAFGLNELQRLSTLTDDGVRDHIFSAGIAGAGRSAQSVMKGLQSDLEGLLRPRASAHINDLAKQLSETLQRVKEARKHTEQYETLREREQSLIEQVERSTEALKDHQDSLKQYQAIRQVWPDWNERRQALQQLQESEAVDGIAPDALTKVTHAEEKAQELGAKLEQRKAQQDTLQHKIDNTELDETLLAVEGRITSLASGLTLQTSRLEEDLPRIQAELDEEQSQLDTLLEVLGPDWDETRITTFDPSERQSLPDDARVDERWLARAKDVSELHQELGTQQYRLEQVEQLKRDAERNQGNLNRYLSQLGPGWNAQAVAAFDEAQAWRSHAKGVSSQLNESKEKHRTALARYELTGNQVRTAESDLQALSVPSRELPAIEADVKALTEKLGLLERVSGERDEYLRRRQEVRNLRASLASTGEQTPGRSAWVVLAVSGLLPLAAAFWVYDTHPEVSLALVVLALVLLVVNWPRTNKVQRDFDQDSDKPVTLQSLDAHIKKERHALQSLKTGLEQQLGTLQLDGAVEEGGKIGEALRLAEENLESRKAELNAASNYQTARQKRDGLQEQHAKDQAQLEELQAEIETLEANWRDWCAEHGLREGLTPDTFESYLQEIDRAAEVAHNLTNDHQELEKLEEKIDLWRSRAKTVCEQLGVEGAGEGNLETLVPSLESWLQDERTKKANLEALTKNVAAARDQAQRVDTVRAKLASLQARIDRWEGDARDLLNEAGWDHDLSEKALVAAVHELNNALTKAQQLADQRSSWAEEVDSSKQEIQSLARNLEAQHEHIEQLLQKCGATDIDHLQRRLDVQEQRASWQQKVREAEMQLRAVAGQQYERMAAELDKEEPLRWEEECRRLEDEVDRLEGTLDGEDGLRAQRTEVRLEREALEQSSDLAQHLLQVENLKQQLQRAMRQWVITKLAYGLVERTLQTYERTRVPEVLKHASDMFRAITQGRYTRIQNTDARTFRVFTSDEQVVDASLLSRGAQEQLYLAVRLGLAASFSNQKSPLPLVMDDVLVNADPERAQVLADALAQTTDRHQLIFLTCHPHTASMLKERVNDYDYLALKRLSHHGVDEAPGADAGSDSSSGDLDQLVLDRVLETLAAAPDEGLGRSDICRRADVPEGEFLKIMNLLMEQGQVGRSGEKRGTRYHRVPVGR